MNNLLFNRGEIKEKGTEIINTSSVEQITKFAINDALYGDIKTLKMYKQEITIETLNGGKFSYVFMDQEYTQQLKQVLSICLKEKFIEE